MAYVRLDAPQSPRLYVLPKLEAFGADGASPTLYMHIFWPTLYQRLWNMSFGGSAFTPKNNNSVLIQEGETLRKKLLVSVYCGLLRTFNMEVTVLLQGNLLL